MISLVQPARLQTFYRFLSTSSAARARAGPRGGRARTQAFEDDRSTRGPPDDDYQPLDAPSHNHFRPANKKNFDLRKFTDGVRGDLRPDDERRLFKEPKPEWMEKSGASKEAWRAEEPAGFDAFGLEVEREPPPKEKTKKKEIPIRKVPDSVEADKKSHRKTEPRKTKGNSPYPYLEDKDPMFKKILTDVKNRTLRAKSRKILLEGHRLINEALENGVRITTIFFSHLELMETLSEESMRLMKTEVYQVSPKQMALWSDMTTPPGVMAVSEMPDPGVMDSTRQMPLTVVLDNIRDPGNMGAMIRVLAAAACSQIICMKGCVDPWDSKVLRAAMGGHFHVPIEHNMEWELVGNYLPNPASVYLADNLEEKAPAPYLDMGVTRGARLFPKKQIHNLELVPYHHADFQEGSVVLIIGGETSGVSWSAYQATAERRGRKLVIPMGNYVESLNAASVVAVLAFEMRRQRLLLDDDFVPLVKEVVPEEESPSEETKGKLL